MLKVRNFLPSKEGADVSSPLHNLKPDETLAILATPSGYTVFPKEETAGVINGFSSPDDETMAEIVESGITVVDVRGLDNEQLARFSYLNTLTPSIDSRFGPAGMRNHAHVQAWLGVCEACGAELHNAKAPKLASNLFAQEYATRLVAEGILETVGASWRVHDSDGLSKTKSLLNTVSKLPSPASDFAAGRMRNQIGDIIIGEVLLAHHQGESEQAGLRQARAKLRDFSDSLSAQIKTLPALANSYPIDLIKQTGKHIVREMETSNRHQGPSVS